MLISIFVNLILICLVLSFCTIPLCLQFLAFIYFLFSMLSTLSFFIYSSNAYRIFLICNKFLKLKSTAQDSFVLSKHYSISVCRTLQVGAVV